jgi:pimeloyl-ACP methyl ester carboxylesterase
MTTQSIYKSAAGQQEILALYNKVLSQWPVPSEHLHIPTRHGDTFVIAGGDLTAPPLVLLHGTASNSATWAGDVVEYSKHYRVYAVDIPGEPGKSDPARFSWNGPAFSEWLDDVLNELQVEQAILVGMSLGGWAALRYAIDQPDRVNQLVAIVPSGVCQPRIGFILRVVFFFLLGDWGRQRLRKMIFKDMAMPEDLDLFLTLVDRHFNYRMGSPPLFTDEELQSLAMPVLYLAGEQDAILNTQKTAERLQKLLPDVTINIFKNDGHATINMAPRAVSFLQDKVVT